MDNAPDQTIYNKESQRVARPERMEVRTTDTYSPCQNKDEIVIKIIKGKANKIRVQRNIPKRVWDFGMVWEVDIYSRTAGKYVCPSLELLTGDTIDIYEWLEFEFYELVQFWNIQSDDTNPMLGRWLDVSNRAGSALCHWILSEKLKVLSQTTVQYLTSEEPRDPGVQEWIRDYHGSLEDALGSEDFFTSFYGYESFVNDHEQDISKGGPNKEGYQGHPDSPEIDEIRDNIDEERAANSYD